jgi:alkanesulfonate monooxygenase SsuD/methylene tetrahydromethanopterin reductase-like flavin-dependent oxidoreductase (luciferase family)
MAHVDTFETPGRYPVRFGIHSGQQYMTFGECVKLWQRAEQLGYQWASLFDHLRPPVGGPAGPCLDGPTLLAALAGATHRIRCGMLVSPVTWRHPAVAATVACTVDHVSRGRLEWGIGAGGADLAYRQYGIVLPPVDERMARLDEACEILTRLWGGDAVDMAGRYYRLKQARVVPRPVQSRIPLVVGGGGERRLLAIAARYADVWNSIAMPAQDYRRKCQALAAHCEHAGRSPAGLRRSLTFRAVLAATPREAQIRAERVLGQLGPGHPDHAEYLTIGTPGQCVEDLGVFHSLGVTDFLLGCRPPLDWDTIELMALEVAPAFRS